MLNKLLVFAFAVLLLGSCSGKKENNEQENTSDSAGGNVTAEEQVLKDEHPGKALFKQHCSVCHQADGSGVPGMYPPLAESEYVQGDVKWLVTTIVKGREGAITVKGEEYNNIMPPMAYLTDEEISNILSYARQSFGNKAGEVTVEEVNNIRKELQ